MKHLVVGDSHGQHRNLRKFLQVQGVIDKKGNAVNRDEFKVYCTGDLIDGGVNRQGDMANMDYAPEWFDAVVLGNHEMAFIGGHEYSSRRKHDRQTSDKLLELIDKGIYVPATLIPGGPLGDFLGVHGGFSSEFGFDNAADAYQYINVMWELAAGTGDEIAIFDWQGPGRGYYNYCDPVGGIFELDWSEKRNTKFNQVVGHSIFYDGPIVAQYGDVTHWNVDVGAKVGKGQGAVVIDDVEGSVTPIYWGERYTIGKTKKYYFTENKVEKEAERQLSLVNGIMRHPEYEDKIQKIIDDVDRELALELEKQDDGSYAYPGTNDRGSEFFREIGIADLDDTYIELIDDPEILEVYMQEVGRRDMTHSRFLH